MQGILNRLEAEAYPLNADLVANGKKGRALIAAAVALEAAKSVRESYQSKKSKTK